MSIINYSLSSTSDTLRASYLAFLFRNYNVTLEVAAEHLGITRAVLSSELVRLAGEHFYIGYADKRGRKMTREECLAWNRYLRQQGTSAGHIVVHRRPSNRTSPATKPAKPTTEKPTGYRWKIEDHGVGKTYILTSRENGREVLCAHPRENDTWLVGSRNPNQFVSILGRPADSEKSRPGYTTYRWLVTTEELNNIANWCIQCA